MSGDFENKVALVTGGSRGIGRATALQLAEGGADVAISYCSRVEPADEVVAEIEKLGRKAIHMPCNVAKQDDIDAMVEKTREALGPIDLLAHCGAISSVATHDELSVDQWLEMIDVNLNGAFRVVWAVKDEMLKRGSGSMVMISSIAALRQREKQIHYASFMTGQTVVASGGRVTVP
jgi:3-oxoacyl-[acyl-carrier protein] reductase